MSGIDPAPEAHQHSTPDAPAFEATTNFMDTETDRVNVALLPDEIAYLQLDTIRERRLHAAKVFAEVQEMKKKARSERVKEMLDKQLSMYEKKYASVSRLLDDMEVRANKIRALRLELDALT